LGALFASIYAHATANRLGRVYVAPFDVVLGEKTALQPDILFVAASRLGIIGPEYIIGPPDLVVEVLSPHRVSYDRVTKLEQYALHGVGEYWLIDPMAENVALHLLRGERYELKETLSGDQILSTSLLPGWEIPVRRLFQE